MMFPLKINGLGATLVILFFLVVLIAAAIWKIIADSKKGKCTGCAECPVKDCRKNKNIKNIKEKNYDRY